MNGRILGFQRLARCPKWTPASIRSLTWTIATHGPPAPKAGHHWELWGRREMTILVRPPPRGKGAIVPAPAGRVKRFLSHLLALAPLCDNRTPCAKTPQARDPPGRRSTAAAPCCNRFISNGLWRVDWCAAPLAPDSR